MSLLPRILSRWWTQAAPGVRGEREAARFLKAAGYRILVRNLRTTLGEIDILAEAPDGRTIVVVEVKARVLGADTTDAGVRPEVHVDPRKQRKLASLAAQLARDRGLSQRPIRFDVIGVDLPPRGAKRGTKAAIRHHLCAFESRF